MATEAAPNVGVKRQRTEPAETKMTGVTGTATGVSTTQATPNQHATNPEFARLLLTMKVERLPIQDNRIFVAQRTDRIIDVRISHLSHCSSFPLVPVVAFADVRIRCGKG